MNIRYCIFLILVATGCNINSDKHIDFVLECAKENKYELGKVLEQCSDNPEKLISARFLIENMIGKSTIDSNSVSLTQPYFDALIEYHKKRGSYQNDIQKYICDSVKKISQQVIQNPVYLPDIKYITANFLLSHIDYSFRMRESNKWQKDIDFELFCKYVLPYTTNNSYWIGANQFFYEKYKNVVDTACSLISAANQISEDIDKTFLQNWVLFSIEHPHLLPTTFKNLALAQIGTCLEQNTYKIAALRAMGIPSVLNTIPVWGNSAHPHFWTEIIQKNNRRVLYENNEIPFVSEKEMLINGMFWGGKHIPTYEGIPSYINVRHTRTIPKVYRVNYELQKNGLALQSDEAIPAFFKNLGLEDITNQYIETADVDISLWRNEKRSKNIYLCCYDFQAWTAVDWAVAKRGKASFKNVGVNVLYLPAYYQNGMLIPAGNPFILERNGDRRELCKSSDEFRNKIILYTKYPYRANVMGDAMTMVGGRFQLANTSNFSDTTTVHEITQTPFYEGDFNINEVKAYRYLICNFNDINPFYLGEIKVFGKDERGNEILLSGNIVGNAGKARATIQNVADNDRVSYFANNPTFPEQYIAFDFGKPVHLSRVRYNPRSDDNRVVSGELYELFYWHENGWTSLGKQSANNNRLVYSNVPENVLFYLHNHTRGQEHRPFTYENERQVWW